MTTQNKTQNTSSSMEEFFKSSDSEFQNKKILGMKAYSMENGDFAKLFEPINYNDIQSENFYGICPTELVVDPSLIPHLKTLQFPREMEVRTRLEMGSKNSQKHIVTHIKGINA